MSDWPCVKLTFCLDFQLDFLSYRANHACSQTPQGNAKVNPGLRVRTQCIGQSLSVDLGGKRIGLPTDIANVNKYIQWN